MADSPCITAARRRGGAMRPQRARRSVDRDREGGSAAEGCSRRDRHDTSAARHAPDRGQGLLGRRGRLPIAMGLDVGRQGTRRIEMAHLLGWQGMPAITIGCHPGRPGTCQSEVAHMLGRQVMLPIAVGGSSGPPRCCCCKQWHMPGRRSASGSEVSSCVTGHRVGILDKIFQHGRKRSWRMTTSITSRWASTAAGA